MPDKNQKKCSDLINNSIKSSNINRIAIFNLVQNFQKGIFTRVNNKDYQLTLINFIHGKSD